MSRINLPTHTIQGLPPIELDHLSANHLPDSGLLQSESTRLLHEMMLTLDQKGGEPDAGAASENVIDSSLAMGIHATETTHPAGITDKLLELDAPGPPPPPARSSLRLVWIWVVLAFAAGSVCYNVTLHLAQELMPKIKPVSAPVAPLASTAQPASARPWIETVTDYQKLYARETLSGLGPSPKRFGPAINAFRGPEGWAIQAPDFRAAGFIFKGMQRLSFNGQPLIQLMYLPKSGPPVSLYVIKESHPDETALQKRVGILNIISWRRNNLRYALIGEPENVDLATLGKPISIPEGVGRE